MHFVIPEFRSDIVRSCMMYTNELCRKEKAGFGCTPFNFVIEEHI